MLEEIFDDLLTFLFPKANQVFDFERGVEFLDKELAEMYPEPDKAKETKFVDKLVKVYNRDGTDEWVLVHVEVQGHHDPDFAKRMFKYFCRIFDRYDRPLTAIAIFTGKDGKKLPDRYERRFQGTDLIYKYNTLCILDFTDEELELSNNPFAWVVRVAKKALLEGKDLDSELLRQKLIIAKSLYHKGFIRQKIDALLTFLHNYIRFADPKFNRIFMEELDQITGKKNTMGIIEYIKEQKIIEISEKVRTAKEISVVKNLLSGTDFSTEKIAAITGVSVAFVEEVRTGKH